MARYSSSKIRNAVYLIVSFVFLIPASLLYFSQTAMAIYTGPPRIDIGYFYGYAIILNSNNRGSYVLSQGIPNYIDTKSEFIDYIKNLRGGLAGDKQGDIIGASYIIQTMRGADGSGEWDHYLPDADDIRDWENRINDTEITIAPSENYTYTINTRRDRDGIGPNRHDVSKYSPGTSTESSFVFYKNGIVQYAIKRSCGNPLGSLSGLPPPTPKNWSLTPYVSLNPTNYIEAGSSFNITSYINNTGEVTSGDVTYNLEKKVGSGSYSTFSPHSGTRTFPLGTTYVTNNLSFSDTDYDAGTQICFRLSVTPRSNTNAATLTSTEDCIIIGKKPKVQVWGGDLWVRGNIQTSSSIKNSRMYGSWEEYALFAGGRITGMASGSAIATGLASYSDVCNYSKLTFANTPVGLINSCSNDTLNKGYYDTASRLIPDVASSFPTTNSNPTISTTIITNAGGLNGLSSGVYRASNTSAISINLPSTISNGKWIVINAPNNDVNINYDISYANGPYTRISQIPQVVIIAKSITINSDVTNVDAWLIAHNKITEDGLIKTCNVNIDERLVVNSCRNLLTINGPVMTDNLYLLRTAGSGTGTSSGDPAEIINLRADAYLWAYSKTLGQGRIRTVHMRELPPRF